MPEFKPPYRALTPNHPGSRTARTKSLCSHEWLIHGSPKRVREDISLSSCRCWPTLSGAQVPQRVRVNRSPDGHHEDGSERQNDRHTGKVQAAQELVHCTVLGRCLGKPGRIQLLWRDRARQIKEDGIRL
jgi:hypothetical protein